MSPSPILNAHDSNPNGINTQTDPNPKPTTKPHPDLSTLAQTPIDRLWRGDKEGNIKLQARVPTFDDPYQEREWIKEHMAGSFRYWGKLGFGEGASGHITVRDPVLRDHYWMNPFAVHFSSMTKSKLVLVGPDGYVSPHGAQLPINTAGYYIHDAIHKARPEINVAAHCHSINASAWSAFGRPIDILQQDASIFYDNLSVYDDYSGLVLASEEGENIARALGEKSKACVLRNHGLVTLGQTVDEAVYVYGLLDKHCKIQLMVEAAGSGGGGLKKRVISDEDSKFNAETEGHWEALYVAFQAEYELLVEETDGKFLK